MHHVLIFGACTEKQEIRRRVDDPQARPGIVGEVEGYLRSRAHVLQRDARRKRCEDGVAFGEQVRRILAQKCRSARRRLRRPAGRKRRPRTYETLPLVSPAHPCTVFSGEHRRVRRVLRAKDTTSVPASPSPPPPTTLNIRYRRRSRNQARQQSARKPPPKKDWESMTLGEKAVELYVGEKGLLFWLNKFAYASIFIIAGGWILFRFVGPSLGLYQLDSAPLPPSAIFKG
ncbi:hypothetical protein C4D60_Mb01t12970 [Musa balbisiana]|uniref:Uncharacterized protein n=1 Tax=Musa balbisiana TaxID=52838 RepID=A0A4S8JN64_MUSBA|nr:hypothetical protein C4D60_Mb01t12970 [Musa balbisiana]